MYKHLIARNAKALARIGRRILAGLRVDPRLDEAASTLAVAQGGLEAKVSTWEAAADSAEHATTERDKAYRVLSDAVRYFGFVILSVTGNHHDADPYLRYFPYGYGDARTLMPAQILNFVRLLLVKLEEETDPRILAGKDMLVSALDVLVNAEAACEAAVRASDEAFAVVQVEKRNWTRGLARSRGLAESGCFYDHAYVRQLYVPAKPSRGSGAAEEDEDEAPTAKATAETPTAETPAAGTPPAGSEGGTESTSTPARGSEESPKTAQ